MNTFELTILKSFLESYCFWENDAILGKNLFENFLAANYTNYLSYLWLNGLNLNSMGCADNILMNYQLPNQADSNIISNNSLNKISNLYITGQANDSKPNPK